MYDAKYSDDLWLVVKCLSNSAIAGSPRNIFRYSPKINCTEVEILKGMRVERLQFPTKLRMPYMCFFGVSPWELSSRVERETTQTVD